MAFNYSSLPVLLTIAGSDSGGGAGIQADLKTFAALGAYGTSAITAITAQNPDGVSAIQGIDPPVVAAQIAAVGDYFSVGAAKTGMLFSAEIIEAIAPAYAKLRTVPQAPQGEGVPPLVVDPVMVATSGAKLLNDDAIGALEKLIVPLATVLTPNMDEAALLSQRTVESEADLEAAARAIYDRFGVAVLVKGGHLKAVDEVVDCFFDGQDAYEYRAPYMSGINTHGTGCTLSAAIAAYLMRGYPPLEAVGEGREYLRKTMADALPVGRDVALNHGFGPLRIEMI
ncbi:MAG TPA: bifunctional hydroxymethylpyrimidine kinase/phosphomethylpyrimidine kinase [bacterium]|nr:bifunctional hydroxymethylpyrimidine kinase/phosphomethylpyrimidine kinase [bacterium]